jgi:hypothetical protein
MAADLNFASRPASDWQAASPLSEQDLALDRPKSTFRRVSLFKGCRYSPNEWICIRLDKQTAIILAQPLRERFPITYDQMYTVVAQPW